MTSERNIILDLKPIYKLYLEKALLQNIIFSKTATEDAFKAINRSQNLWVLFQSSGQGLLSDFHKTGEEVNRMCKHFSAVLPQVNKSLECISPSRLPPFGEHLSHFLCSQSLLLICPQVHSWLSCLTVSAADGNIVYLSAQSNKVHPQSYLHQQVTQSQFS